VPFYKLPIELNFENKSIYDVREKKFEH